MSVTAFKIDIITPEETYFSGEAVSLVVPGIQGYLGILVNHAPLVTPLGIGKVEMRLADRSEKSFEIEGGFLEVAANQATLLVEKIKVLSGASVPTA